MDLRFGCRGQSAPLGGGETRLWPDKALVVQRMVDGSRVDTRPVLIIDLPAQHILEEAWFCRCGNRQFA